MALEYPCISCFQEVKDDEQAIQCERCDKWQHRTCDTGFTEAEYNAALNLEKDLVFFCKPCTEPVTKRRKRRQDAISSPAKRQRISFPTLDGDMMPDLESTRLSFRRFLPEENEPNKTVEPQEDVAQYSGREVYRRGPQDVG